jgi:hypothetical protein
MRSVLALGLLIALCVSANAATVHRAQTATFYRSSQPGCDGLRSLRHPGLDRRTDPVLVG